MWTLALGQHEDRTPTHGYAGTREAAMAAFAKSWRREKPEYSRGSSHRTPPLLWLRLFLSFLSLESTNS
jgi:hypothetical protein